MKMREIHKVVVMGAGGVGKTSIVRQFMEGYYLSNYKPTVEDYYRHTIQLTDGVFQTVEILDTAGMHYFPAMRELNIRSGRGFVIMFAVDSMSSFLEAVHLYEKIIQIKETSLVPIVLVGNKSDLKDEREVPLEVVLKRKHIDMHNCPYIETSAKYNCNISQLFLQLLQRAKQQHQDDPSGRGRGRLLLMRRLSSSFGSLPNISLLRRRSSTPLKKQHSSASSTSSNTTAHSVVSAIPKPAPSARRLLELQLRNLPASGGALGSSGSLGSSCSSSNGSMSSGASSCSASNSTCGSPVAAPCKIHMRLQALRAASDASESSTPKTSKIGLHSPVLSRRILQNLVRPQLSLDENRLPGSKNNFEGQTSKNSFDSGAASASSGSLLDMSALDEQRCSIM